MSFSEIAVLMCFAAVGVVIAALSLRRPSGVIEYPFLAAAVMLGWVFPQLVGVALNEVVPPEALTKTVIFSAACLTALSLGYERSRRRPQSAPEVVLSAPTLTRGAALLTFFGLFFFVQVTRMAAEAINEYGGLWTGTITIYVFLSSALTIGMIVAFVVQIHQPSKLALAIAGAGATALIYRVIIEGRREHAATLFVVALLFMWFRYRWLPPRLLIIVMLFIGTLFVHNAGAYRDAMLRTEGSYGWSGAGLSELTNIDFVENIFSNIIDPTANQELMNAALSIEATDRTKSFDLGLSLWNDFINSYVPGQIVGADVKKSFMIPIQNSSYYEFGHIPQTGTTMTGMSDAFGSFWYLGVLVFFLMGRITGMWFNRADGKSPVAQMIIMIISGKSLLALTHSTHAFFLSFIDIAVFLAPVLYLSRSSSKGLVVKIPEISRVKN